MRDLIEKEARNSVVWFRDNRLCVSADKSKLLICDTKPLIAAREVPSMSIEVEGEIIDDSASEKLLYVVLNNEFTWKHHIYVFGNVFNLEKYKEEDNRYQS